MSEQLPFRIRRSAVEGKRPQNADLELGELALNTYDGRLFAKKDTGGVGVGTTVTLLTPWTETVGVGLYYTEGNVGLGTTNPTTRLWVSGDINFTGNLYQNGTIFQSGGGTSSQWTTYPAGISTLSNVGIGTTNPTTKLQVNGSVTLGAGSTDLITIPGRIASNFYPTGDGVYDIGRPTQIGLGANRWRDANFYGKGSFDSGVDAHDIEIGIGSANLIYSTFGNLELNSQSGTTNIDDNVTISGNTGIGTATPTSKLHVIGNANITGIITTTSINFANSGLLGDPYGDGGFGLKSAANQVAIIASNNLQQYLQVDDNQIFIGTGYASTTGSYDWVFDRSGNLTFPDNTSQSTAFTGYANTAGIASYATNAGVSTYAITAGIATTATTALGFSTTASINTSGIITASSFTGNLSGTATTATNLSNAANITTGNISSSRLSGTYGIDITGTATTANNLSDAGNITTGTISSSRLSGTYGISITGTATTANNLYDAANITTGTINKDRISNTNSLTILGDLYVSNNISFGGSTTQLNTQQLQIVDADIVLGIGTSFSPTDNTANHGGIAIASTEGTPLVDLNIVPEETNPSTYKKIMWFKGSTIGAGLTDAWLFNYGVGIGSTQVPNGVRLSVGQIQMTDSAITATTFTGNLSGTATTSTTLSNAANITTGTISSSRLSGSYGISITGTATTATTALGFSTTASINTSGIITASSFVKSNGTSSQFLKADGSVDSNTYLTTTGSGTALTGIVTSIVAGTGITISGSTGQVTINASASGGSSSQWTTYPAGISTTSNVGIGTTNPGSKLTVNGAIQIQQDSGSNNRLVFRGQPASSYRWNVDNFGSANDFRIFREDDDTAANGSVAVSISTIGTLTATKFSGDGSLLTNLPGGSGGSSSSQWVTTAAGIHTLSNVGIGTTNPTSRLTVSGNASITGILTVDQVYTSNNNTGQNIRIGDDLWIGDINLANGTRFSGVQDSTKAFIVFGTSDTVALGRTGTGPLYYGGDFTISGIATANSFRARGGAPGALGVNNNGYGFFAPGDNDSGMYSSTDGQIEFYTNSTEAVRIDSNQRVGIGTTNPTSTLTVRGNAFITGVTTSTDFNSTSDFNLKTNIQQIEDSLSKVIQIRGVTFDWKETNRSSAGVIAQEIEKVFPELVQGENPKTVNYNGLIGLLIEAIKEQQVEINILKEKLK